MNEGTTAWISVIIPTRNRAELLAGAITASEGQTYPQIEIIVVDDGSTDDTADVIAEAVRRNPRVRALHLDAPVGAAAARNAGAAIARGKYLLFEDDDCRGAPDKVALLVEALERSPSAAYAYCYWRVVTIGDRSEILHTMNEPWSMTTSAVLLRAQAFRAAGEFDPQLPRLQDFDLWTRILARAPAVAVPRVLFDMARDHTGISASVERLIGASEILLRKYRDSDLPRPHLAAMHRRLGGKLMLVGCWKQGLAHQLRAVHLGKLSPRSWLALAAGVAGPSAYRAVAGISDRVRQMRAGGYRDDNAAR